MCFNVEHTMSEIDQWMFIDFSVELMIHHWIWSGELMIIFTGSDASQSNNMLSIFARYPPVMTNSLLWKMAIEIVEFPMNSMVIFHSYVKLPESNFFIFFADKYP